MPDWTGKRYTLRLTNSAGATSRVEIQELAWRGFDTQRWRFKDWPDEKVIRDILIAYRPVEPFVDSWFVRDVEIDPRRIGFPGKAKSIGRLLCMGLVNATITANSARIEGEPPEFEPLQLDLGETLTRRKELH